MSAEENIELIAEPSTIHGTPRTGTPSTSVTRPTRSSTGRANRRPTASTITALRRADVQDLPRQQSRQSALQDPLRQWGLDLFHRPVHRHHDRCMVLADGTEIPPTGKPFEVDFCTVARWDNGQIVEENLFYESGRDDVPARTQQLTQGSFRGAGRHGGRRLPSRSRSVTRCDGEVSVIDDDEMMPAVLGPREPDERTGTEPLYRSVASVRRQRARPRAILVISAHWYVQPHGRHRHGPTEDHPRLLRISRQALRGAVSRSR